MTESRQITVTVPGGPALPGILRLPEGAAGLVIFAHGSGSSRLSPRNTHVAEALGRAGFATLLFDLLTEAEAADRANVFDIGLLTARVVAALDWAAAEPATAALPVGLFGASTGAASALGAAAERPATVRAVVSRGGRPDLAGGALRRVACPVLLIVGGWDREVLELNRDAAAAMRVEVGVAVVPGATHLFEEPGALDRVVDHAIRWFTDHLSPR